MVISFEDFAEIRTIAQKKGEAVYRKTDFEIENGLPESLGEGGTLSINLRGGVSLEIIQGKLRQTLRMKRQHGSDFPLVSKFYVSGSSRVRTQDS
ncbi:MAG: AraC family transcriptional regulator, partial [Cyanobacteria bacterium P01_A01_bin.17]